MKSWIAAASMILVAAMATASPQEKQKPSGNTAMHELTVNAGESVYTGTMELTIDRGKVTGKMHITAPTEVTGNVAGTSAKGVMALDFPFVMTERKCEGNAKMDGKLPPKPGPSSGTIEIVGCGRDATNKLIGTFDLKPVAPTQKPVKN